MTDPAARPTPAAQPAAPTPNEPVDGAWHALGAEEVESILATSRSGLTDDEAAGRLARVGPNALEAAKPPTALEILLHQFQSPLIYILLIAAAVTVVLGEYIDAAVIAAVLALNATIGFVQERQADRSVRALMGLVAPRAHVVRSGVEREIASEDLVPGDLVTLESGQRVPADLRLITATALRIDESLLTGESVPAGKHDRPVEAEAGVADRANMAWSGSVVTAGRGRGFVVATGIRTQLGRIAESIRTEHDAETPLQRRMNRFARIIGAVVGVAALASMGIGVALGERLQDMFLVAVALAVAAIPEGLPVVFTITLALGVRRMARRHAIVRRLPAVETLGSTTVIGSDKTGTLTENRMTVQEIWTAVGSVAVPQHAPAGEDRAAAEDVAPRMPHGDPLVLTLTAGILANEATARPAGDGYEIHGDPTEAALLVAAHRLGLDPDGVRAAHETLLEVPFESERRYSAAWCRRDGATALYVKGAPERILELASRAYGPEGPVALDREAVLAAAHEMAGRGLRVLAMAWLPDAALPAGSGDAWDPADPADLVFLGLQGMMDPPREGVAESIANCQRAGIRVVMITGDHGATARAIGARLGIAPADGPVLTGADLDRLGDDELRDRAGMVSIYARVSPEQKLRIVRALQARGEVVAVTGDGVNDAPALKVAEIGVAMGQSGTDIAREAADIVLADDNFTSIYAAVEEGRVTFDNLRKVTFFLISTGAAAILLILGSLLLGWPLPMLPAQLLWLNLVTNGLQDVALAFEPGEPDAARKPPRPRSEGVISALLWERTVIAGIVMGIGTLAMFRWELDTTGSLSSAQTVALSTMVIFQMFQAGNARSDTRSLFRMNPLGNPFLFASVVAALAIHVAALYLGPTQLILRVEPIAVEAWIRIFLVASTLLVAMEAHKAVRRRWPYGGRRPADRRP
jgi:magnesium-transporting ATPase (P-type)